MLLAIDVGNTHTVLGLFEGSEVRAHWRVATRKDYTPDEMVSSSASCSQAPGWTTARCRA